MPGPWQFDNRDQYIQKLMGQGLNDDQITAKLKDFDNPGVLTQGMRALGNAGNALKEDVTSFPSFASDIYEGLRNHPKETLKGFVQGAKDEASYQAPIFARRLGENAKAMLEQSPAGQILNYPETVRQGLESAKADAERVKKIGFGRALKENLTPDSGTAAKVFQGATGVQPNAETGSVAADVLTGGLFAKAMAKGKPGPPPPLVEHGPVEPPPPPPPAPVMHGPEDVPTTRFTFGRERQMNYGADKPVAPISTETPNATPMGPSTDKGGNYPNGAANGAAKVEQEATQAPLNMNLKQSYSGPERRGAGRIVGEAEDKAYEQVRATQAKKAALDRAKQTLKQKAAAPAEAAPAEQPSIVRLYRGESENSTPGPLAGQTFTDNPMDAVFYAKQGGGAGKTYYIDLPAEEAAKYKTADATGQGVHVLPPELAEQARKNVLGAGAEGQSIIKPAPLTQEALQKEAAAKGENITTPLHEDDVREAVTNGGVQQDPMVKFFQHYAAAPTEAAKDGLVENTDMETLGRVRKELLTAKSPDPGLLRRLALNAEPPAPLTPETPVQEVPASIGRPVADVTQRPEPPPPTKLQMMKPSELSVELNSGEPARAAEAAKEVLSRFDTPFLAKSELVLDAKRVLSQQAKQGGVRLVSYGNTPTTPDALRNLANTFARKLGVPKMTGAPLPDKEVGFTPGILKDALQGKASETAPEMKKYPTTSTLTHKDPLTEQVLQLRDEVGARDAAKLLGMDEDTVRKMAGGKPGMIPLQKIQQIQAAAKREIAESGKVSDRTQELLDRIKSERGGIGMRPALVMGGAALGGTLGAAAPADTEDDQTGHMLAGALGGGALGFLPGNIGNLARIGKAARMAGYLTGGAQIKHLATGLGSAVTAGVEGTGDTRLGPMKEMLRLPTNLKNYGAALKTGVVGPYENPTGIGPIDRALKLPNRLIGAAVTTEDKALERAGVAPEDRERYLLTKNSNMLTRGRSALPEGGRAAMDAILPFQRVPGNMFEGSLTAGGDLFRPEVWKTDLGKQAMSLAAVGGGAALQQWAGNDPRKVYLARLAMAVFGHRGPLAAGGALIGAGVSHGISGRKTIGDMLPMPEIESLKSLVGWPPAIVTAVKKLGG